MRPTVRLFATACVLVPGLVALLGCGAAEAPPAAPTSSVTVLAAPGVPGGVISTRTEIQAKVTGKDEAKRTLTLLGADKAEQTIDIPAAAVNFPQVKVGDLVVAVVIEQVAAVVIPAGIPVDQGEALIAGLAEEGQKPGGAIATATQIRAKVVAIDATTRTATIETDAGKRRVLPVRADIDLTRHQIGDQVVMRVTNLVELSVKTPAPAAK